MRNYLTTMDSKDCISYGDEVSKKTNTLYALDDEGNIVEVGEDPIFDKIQEFKEQVDIYNILARYENGDLLALGDSSNAYYGDASIHDENGLTVSLLSSEKNIAVALESFKALPAEVRAMFNDDVVEFLNADDKAIGDALNAYVQNINKPKDEGGAE